MLSDRQKLILKAIIEDYVMTNEPVGSKALTEKPYLDYSSATIRYDMQALEDDEFLCMYDNKRGGKNLKGINMANLHFHYGVMSSSKSAALIITAYNFTQNKNILSKYM